MIRLVLKYAVLAILIAGAAILAARLIFPLPDIADRPASLSIPAAPETALGALHAEGLARHPGKSGVIGLRSGRDALGSRLALADKAERSIDAQYYIWHDDTSGIMLLEQLNRAAQRGVRVRLLLDDNGVPGLDDYMAALGAGENFEIRLFNPSTVRRPKMLGYAIDFLRMNRRMHNKALIVDGAVAIIGGRNIGDEYFELGKAFYVDMDVLATGAIVPETAAMFDQYWNSASVFAVEDVIDGGGDPAAYAARAQEVMESDKARRLIADFRSSADVFAQGATALEWTDVQLVADDPVKGMGLARRDQLMISRLVDILGAVERRLDLVSAYFVPGKRGTALFAAMAQAGREVRILTNALDTTDVLMVHAGYSRYRRALLEAGIALFELKLRGDMTPEADLQIKPLGLSGASLHAKTFAVDDARIFIGSFNFDPRSAMLNCEMGFLIDSPDMARAVSRAFDGTIARISYRPDLTPEGKMIWREEMQEGRDVIYQEEPGATWFQQIGLAIIGVLPVEWLL
jgi:cardiolipin synthase C